MTTTHGVSLAASLAPIAEGTPSIIARRFGASGGVPDLSTLTILIISPPKTGNNWVEHLLSTVYVLPITSTGITALEPAIGYLEMMGQRWITHLHWTLTSELIGWARAHGVIFVTI